jgi:hypothetical protein
VPQTSVSRVGVLPCGSKLCVRLARPESPSLTKKGPRSFTRRPFSHFQSAAERQRIDLQEAKPRASCSRRSEVLPSYFFFFFLAAFLVAIVGYLSFHWLPSGPNFNSRLRESNSELPLSLLPSWQLSSGRSLPLCSPITAPSPRRKQGHRRRCGISTSGSFTCRALRRLREMTGCSFALLAHSSSEFLRAVRAFRSRLLPTSAALHI